MSTSPLSLSKSSYPVSISGNQTNSRSVKSQLLTLQNFSSKIWSE